MLVNKEKTGFGKYAGLVILVILLMVIIILGGLGISTYYYQKKLNSDLSTKRSDAVNIETLRLGLSSMGTGFYPNIQNDYYTLVHTSQYYEGLTMFDKDMKIKPLLASSWENPAENLNIWRFRLKSNIKFHDGSTMDADDVKASFDLALSSENISPIIPNIKEIKIIDPVTVDVITNNPDPILANTITNIYILPKEKIVTKDFENPIGTGPYKFIALTDKEGTYTRYDDYWNSDRKPLVKNLIIKIYNDKDEELTALKNGDIDMMEASEDESGQSRNDGKKILMATREPIDVSILGINLVSDKTTDIQGASGNPLKNVKVRQAMQLALNPVQNDNPYITRSSQLVSPTIFGYNAAIKSSEQSIENARTLMEEAGYKDGFSVKLIIGEPRKKDAENIKSQLAQIGINITIDYMSGDAASFEKFLSGVDSLYLASWGCQTGDALEAYENFLLSSSPGNIYKYSNEEADELIGKIKKTFEQSLRKDYFRQLSEIVDSEKPYIPYNLRKNAFAYREGIGFALRADGNIMAADLSGQPVGIPSDYDYFGALKKMLRLN